MFVQRALFVLLATGALFLLTAQRSAPPSKKFALTIDNIMRGPGLVGYEPTAPRWAGDNQRIYFEWKQASDPEEKPLDTYVVSRDGSPPRKLSEEEARLAPPVEAELSKDRKQAVYVRDNDVWIYDFTSDSARRITHTADIEANPHFTRDGKRIYFTRSGNLYLMALDTGLLDELTDIRPPVPTPQNGSSAGAVAGGRSSDDDDEKKGTASQEFVKKEERELLAVVRERAKWREEEKARRKRENPRKPLRLAARENVTSLQLSPDEKTVVATISERPESAKTTVVPNFVTESGYTEDIPGRTKVGDVNASVKVGLISVESGEVKWIEHGQKLAPKPEIRTEGSESQTDNKKAAERTEIDASRKPPEPQERPVRMLEPVWSEDGSKAVLLARSADNKDRWILALDTATGKTRVLVSMHDDAWIDGPGANTLGWMRNDTDIFFQSEKTGYSHLYTVPFSGGEPKQLTSGPFEVSGVRLSEDKRRFYLTTNEGDPGQVHLYSMPAEGGSLTRITSSVGNHRTVLSRDERWIADIHSSANRPPELFVMPNEPGGKERNLTASPSPEFFEYPWVDVPIVQVPARDGVKVPARLYKPANLKRGSPAVIFVHGAGYLQNVHKWWSSYYREYMFHHFLLEHGYVVIDVDYRGSAGYGRDWRTAIYRHMGGKDLDDQVDAAKWLVSTYGVDPKKIGIYGGSYGGFITLMAMFTQPDVFAAGAALRPVTDWAHYNHGYTSNILNLPQEDAEAYRKSSPIYFAAGFKGALLICHGMVDTNVHFQDTVRLTQKLIELRKENWELAAYPVENHGFVEPTSWADEYSRIFRLFEKNLK